MCQVNNTRCNDIKRQTNREKLKEKKSLVSYWSMKQELGRLDISRPLSLGYLKQRAYRNKPFTTDDMKDNIHLEICNIENDILC
jgi:hypothetical protein